jgi:hypothetical protein
VIGALATAAAVAIAVAGQSEPAQPVTARAFPSVTEALKVALAGNPVVVAFGELHQTTATSRVPSALSRFTAEIVPAFADRFSHVVIETWVTDGRCGAVETAVTADVQKTTERPAATETEIEALIRTAAARAVVPRILKITCADYAEMRPADGRVDYDRTLRITAQALQTAIARALRERGRVGSEATSGQPRPSIAVYGGALHNDVRPDPDLAAYSYAPGILAATLGRYVEIDLIVPAYVRASATSLAQAQSQGWWRPYLRARGVGVTTVLIRRGPRSFVIVFPAKQRQ